MKVGQHVLVLLTLSLVACDDSAGGAGTSGSDAADHGMDGAEVREDDASPTDVEGTDADADGADSDAASTDTEPDGDGGDPADAADTAADDASDAAEDADAADTAADDASDAAGDGDAADAAGDGDAADGPDSPPTGPQLVSSSPANGEINAARVAEITLRFDRPIPLANLEVTVYATSELIAAPSLMEPARCPDAPLDETCAVMTFAAPFIASAEGLAPATYHVVRIDRSLEDSEGHTADADTRITFATEGALRVVDDSMRAEDAYGLAYDPTTRSLFYCAWEFAIEPPFPPGVVRRIRLDGSPPYEATTYATIAPSWGYSFGCELDLIDGKLFVSLPNAAEVRVFDDLRWDGATASRIIDGYSLPDPVESLTQVTGVASLDEGERLFFSFGNLLVAPRPAAIAELSDGVWSHFGSGSYSTAEEFVVTAREEVTPGVVYVAVTGEIVALSAETGERLNAQEVATYDNWRIWVDSAGRLLFEDEAYALLTVFDTAGSEGFELLGSLDTSGRGRFAVRERGNVYIVYSMSYWSPAEIYRQQMILCEGPEPCVSSCDNQVLDLGETATDCGGTCDPCALGETCVAAGDCSSGYCFEGVCTELLSGCADGTREGFVDEDLAPAIAGCSGAWSVPGIVGSLVPSCDRTAGDDGDNREGDGCGAVDLCSEGWHICASPEEVEGLAPGGSCAEATVVDDPFLFFATAVQSGGSGECVAGAPDVANDIFGCGNFGATPPGVDSCAPLNRFSGDNCTGLITIPLSWSCGVFSTREGFGVTKAKADAGGVLCCL